jgi:NADPH2:quinone reductase
MKALRLVKDAFDAVKPSLRSVTVPIPKVTPGFMLVKIHAAAINPSDVLNSVGGFPYTTYPRIPGRDFAGVVQEGPAASIGMRVFGSSGRSISFTQDGTHAEYCLVPERAAAPMPSNLTFAQAACIGVPWSTAHIVLHRAHVQPTDTVLVLGATGAVGSAAVQLARSMGCRVLTAARRDTADINLLKDPELAGAKELTEGIGPDLIVDTIGDPILMRNSIRVLAVHGRISYIAAPRTGEVDFSFNMKDLYRAEHSIVGCNSLQYSAEKIGAILSGLKTGFEVGHYKAIGDQELIKISHGEEVLEAYEAVKKREGKKFVIAI